MGNAKIVKPGDVLLKEYMDPKGITNNDLAKILSISEDQAKEIVASDQPITKDMALTLGYFFETSRQFWIDLQQNYDQCSGR